MSNKTSNILSGPKEDLRVQEDSLGKYLFDCLKKRDPGHVNMIDVISGMGITNGEILQSSVNATKLLRDYGMQKSDVITIIAENTIKHCIPQLSALYIGVTVQLLNPLYSVDELKHALSISKPKLIICSQLSLESVIQARCEEQLLNIKIVLLSGSSENHPEISNFEDQLKHVFVNIETFQPASVRPEQAALILMSSGTTGLPKGVLWTHANMIAALHYLLSYEYLGVTINDVILLVLPFYHAFGAIIQILSVAIGAKLILMSKFQPNVYLESIQKYKATILYIVPPILLFFAKSPMVDDYDTSSIRDIITGGAPAGKSLLEKASERLKIPCVRQLYGMTETSGACTITIKSSVKSEVTESVGVLVPNMLAKVWDCNLKKTIKPSQVGELCFKGPYIMKSYMGDDTSTKLCIDKEGFLHSGDLGYFDDNGNMYIVDRIKDLIKYKGFQIPPAELETLILSHPAVKDCGVVGLPDETAGEIPLAYVVKQTCVDVTEQDIITYVAERISIQKHLYGGVRFVKEIPKTHSGKILRRKLVELNKK